MHQLRQCSPAFLDTLHIVGPCKLKTDASSCERVHSRKSKPCAPVNLGLSIRTAAGKQSNPVGAGRELALHAHGCMPTNWLQMTAGDSYAFAELLTDLTGLVIETWRRGGAGCEAEQTACYMLHARRNAW